MFTEKLYFIDFEYGSYSYRGYDIANHFNEYAGYECDYTLYGVFVDKLFGLVVLLIKCFHNLLCAYSWQSLLL